MKLNKAPCSVMQTVPISKTNSFTRDGEGYIQGGFFRGTQYAWLSRGPILKIVDIKTGEKIAGWKFGASICDFITNVTCAIELPSRDDASNLTQIVVGLECEVIGGMICIFDIQGSRLLRAIRIPGKVVSLSVIDSGSSGCEGCYPLPALLSSMSGIIAVGLQGGKVMLVDICRLTCEDLLNAWFDDDREQVRDEQYPCQLLHISKDDDHDSGTLEKKRSQAAYTGDHLCLLLNDVSFVRDDFILHGPEGNIRMVTKSHSVGITTLLYIPQIASLAVGYSFGCFQIWNLMHLTLSYTSLMMKDPLPVVHLGFQEPSDDPCHFCYLWAVHSCTDEHHSSSTPLGVMYALSYESKEWVDGYGFLYQDFQTCHFRFEYTLPINNNETVTSRCTAFHTLTNSTLSQKHMIEDGYEEVTSENDLSLCMFVWETYNLEGKSTATLLSLFDLNQWYKEQMPSKVTVFDEEQLCYIATFAINDIRKHSEGLVQNSLLDVSVDPQSISQFRSFQPLEEHFYPAALSFVSHCLLDDNIMLVNHPGMQRNVLLYMEKEGPLSIMQPGGVFRSCLAVGLKPLLMENSSVGDITFAEQREFLLCVALENQMLGFLYRCATEWANGSVSSIDCSLSMLLCWGFQRALLLKETAQKICVPLFDHSGVDLDKNERRLLENCSSQLRRLSSLFQGISNDCKFSKLLNTDFKQKTYKLKDVALYFEVLQWFLNVGLLPEFPECDLDSDDTTVSNDTIQRIPYPSSTLAKLYQERRNELKKLSLKTGVNTSLFIDKLVGTDSKSSAISQLWKLDGGSGLYPPPSLQSLLVSYLQSDIDIQTKHSIVIYVFLDLAALLDTEKYRRAIDYFVKFPCAFCMSPSIIKVTQAFWLLDQKNFEDALDMVLDPLVSARDLQHWHHHFIINALLCHGQHSKALEYFTVRKLPIKDNYDIKLKLTLLAMNEQITQAYHFLQQYRNEDNSNELLNYFFQECAKAHQLGTVMKLMLSPAEEELFMNYLQSCKDTQSDDMQVTYYLMRSRIIEALAINEKINFSSSRRPFQSTLKRVGNERSVRDILVDGYAKTLPNVTLQLASYCAQERKAFSTWRQVQRPTPLSVDIHYGTSQPVCYKSSLIHATLEKARETWLLPLSPACDLKEKKCLDVPSVQKLPFLCTPHDNMRHDGREITPVVFPSVTCPSVKRQLEDQGGTPVKRSRLEVTPPVSTVLQKQYKKRGQNSASSNASLLLQSPLIKRITPLKTLEFNNSHEKSTLSKSVGDNFTPQSILKVRNLVRSSISPEKPTCFTPGVSSVRHPEINHIEDRLFTRQIRFSLPTHDEMGENFLPHTSTPEQNVKETVHTLKRKSFAGASPRLPLRSSVSALRPTGRLTSFSKGAEPEDGEANQKSLNTTHPSQWKQSNLTSRISSVYLTVCTPDSDKKSADSQGEDSFYSAGSISVSSEDEHVQNKLPDHEHDSHLSGESYISKMKEVKPRKQLSGLSLELSHAAEVLMNKSYANQTFQSNPANVTSILGETVISDFSEHHGNVCVRQDSEGSTNDIKSNEGFLESPKIFSTTLRDMKPQRPLSVNSDVRNRDLYHEMDTQGHSLSCISSVSNILDDTHLELSNVSADSSSRKTSEEVNGQNERKLSDLVDAEDCHTKLFENKEGRTLIEIVSAATSGDPDISGKVLSVTADQQQITETKKQEIQRIDIEDEPADASKSNSEEDKNQIEGSIGRQDIINEVNDLKYPSCEENVGVMEMNRKPPSVGNNYECAPFDANEKSISEAKEQLKEVSYYQYSEAAVTDVVLSSQESDIIEVVSSQEEKMYTSLSAVKPTENSSLSDGCITCGDPLEDYSEMKTLYDNITEKQAPFYLQETYGDVSSTQGTPHTTITISSEDSDERNTSQEKAEETDEVENNNSDDVEIDVEDMADDENYNKDPLLSRINMKNEDNCKNDSNDDIIIVNSDSDTESKRSVGGEDENDQFNEDPMGIGKEPASWEGQPMNTDEKPTGGMEHTATVKFGNNLHWEKQGGTNRLVLQISSSDESSNDGDASEDKVAVHSEVQNNSEKETKNYTLPVCENIDDAEMTPKSEIQPTAELAGSSLVFLQNTCEERLPDRLPIDTPQSISKDNLCGMQCVNQTQDQKQFSSPRLRRRRSSACSVQSEPVDKLDKQNNQVTSFLTSHHSEPRMENVGKETPKLRSKTLRAKLLLGQSILENSKDSVLIVDISKPGTSQASENEYNSEQNERNVSMGIVEEPSPGFSEPECRSEELPDSETNSTQSEPACLTDVKEVSGSRKYTRSKKSWRRKKSRKTYVLNIQPPDLTVVKEESETDNSQSEVKNATGTEVADEKIYIRTSRSRKRHDSFASSCSDKEALLTVVHEENENDVKEHSPMSSSSRSSVNTDHSGKRKRVHSPSSSPDMKRATKRSVYDTLIVKCTKIDAETPQKKSVASADGIEDYATARRLTRYQKSLMERSMETAKIVSHEIHESMSIDKISGESDGESEASSFASQGSHVRFSTRLQKKKSIQKDISPSQSSQASTTFDKSPQKVRRSRRRSISRGSEGFNDDREGSPMSLRSGRSVSHASSCSSQWPSPTSEYSESGEKPRRKSFQKAKEALTASPARQRGAVSKTVTDSSEPESVEGSDVDKTGARKILDGGNTNDTGSVRGQSSVSSHRGSQATRSLTRDHGSDISDSSRSSKRKTKNKAEKKGTSTPQDSNISTLFSIKEESTSSEVGDSSKQISTASSVPSASRTFNIFTPPTADELKEAKLRRSSLIAQMKDSKRYTAFKTRQTYVLHRKKSSTQ